MIITCETCGTRFKVKSSLIRPAGSKVRCSKCQHVFVAYPSLPEPEFEQSFEKKEKPPSSEADFSSLGTSTFLADAAETEQQLDAFFAEDSESGGDAAFSDTALDAGQGPKADSEATSSGRQQLFESPRAAGADLKGIESAGAGQPDSMELDFLNLSEGRSQEVLMGDLEFDSELRFSDLEPDADLELSDLEQDADPGFSGLEAAAGQGLMDSRPDADLDLSDLELDADLDFPDLEAEMDADFLETEPGMDLDFSDLDAETEEAFQTGAAGREPAFSDPEPDADLDLSDLEQDVDLELPDLEEDTEEELGLSDLETDAGEDIPDSGSDADLEISDLEPDADLDLSELVKQPETESGVEYEEIQPADEEITELSDSQQMEESDPEFAVTEQAEETTSVDTVEEEFDLDLDTFELNLEDEDGFSQDAYSTGEAPGKIEAKTEISEMEEEEEAPGRTEEELFDLDLDFEESDDTDPEPVAPETQIPGSDAEEKPDGAEAEGTYEVNLDLGDAEKEDDDFLGDLDLDFDETPAQESPRADAAGEQEDLDFDIASFDIASFETLPDDQDAGADLELDLEPRQEASSDKGRADDTADAPEPGGQEESVELTEFDLELETSVDTGSVATEDEDFELNLETMFEEGDESEAEKDASLEPVDVFAGRSAAREDQNVEVFEQDFAAQEEPVVFSGVTDEPADRDSLEQARAPEELFEEKSAGFTGAGPQPGKVRKKTVWPILVLILVLAAAAAVGAYAYFYGFGAKKSAGFDAGNRKIAVSDPSYQFIDNQNAGELLVVTGSVTNRYDHARQNIRVESGLHDAQGRQLSKSVAICGNTLGQEQLQRLELGEIQQTLGRRAAQRHQRPVVRPGGSLPFMAVFSSPPGGIEELTVNVLSSEASK